MSKGQSIAHGADSVVDGGANGREGVEGSTDSAKAENDGENLGQVVGRRQIPVPDGEERDAGEVEAIDPAPALNLVEEDGTSE